MKDLLTNMQARLGETVTYVGGVKAVHLLTDENLLPSTTPFPCIGLKDGDVTNQYHVGMSPPKKRLLVDIIGYVTINSLGGAIIGKGGQKGILDLMEDIRKALEWWAPNGYNWVNGEVEETSSSYMIVDDSGQQNKLVQKKKFTMRWTRRM